MVYFVINALQTSIRGIRVQLSVTIAFKALHKIIGTRHAPPPYSVMLRHLKTDVLTL